MLGAYYLDALSLEENRDIESHLGGCELCRAAVHEIVEAVAVLAFVDDEGRRTLLEDFGALHRSGPPTAAFEKFGPGPVTSDWNYDLAVGWRSTQGLAKRTAPSSGSGGSGVARGLPWRPPNRVNRMRSLASTGFLLVAAVLVMTLSGVALLRGAWDTPAAGATATAAREARGIAVSIFATEDAEGLLIRSAVSGMQPGASYLLSAVSADGRSMPVVRWTATGTEREWAGRIAQRLSNVVSVTLMQPAARIEITVPLHDHPS